MSVFVHDAPVALVGAGPVSTEILAEILRSCDRIVAADGGASAVLAAGRRPDLVIGDLDSLKGAVRQALPDGHILTVEEQDTTDFEKCLQRIRAPLILATGVTGGRTDHELAAMNALVRYPERRCIVLGTTDLIFAAPSEIALDLAPGTRVSLFPMAPVTGDQTGLRWPIGGIGFRPDGRIGTSNAALGPVTLRFDGPGMLVILPREVLPQAVAALNDVPPAFPPG